MVPSQLSGAAVIFFQVAVGGSGFSGNHTGSCGINLLEEGSCDKSYKTPVTDRICTVLYGAAFYGTVQYGVCICNSHDVCSHALS